MTGRHTYWILILTFLVVIMVGCKPLSPIDRELQAQGLLLEDGTYLYGFPIRNYGDVFNTPETTVTILRETLEEWATIVGGRDNFIKYVVDDEGVTTMILDYTGSITTDYAVMFTEGNEIYPKGTVAINMTLHINDMTGRLDRGEFRMSVAHELAHAFDYKSGLAARAEFVRSGAAAVSAYNTESDFDNWAETVAAYVVGKDRPVGDSYTREWLAAYLTMPNLPDDQAAPYNPEDWTNAP